MSCYLLNCESRQIQIVLAGVVAGVLFFSEEQLSHLDSMYQQCAAELSNVRYEYDEDGDFDPDATVMMASSCRFLDNY